MALHQSLHAAQKAEKANGFVSTTVLRSTIKEDNVYEYFMGGPNPNE